MSAPYPRSQILRYGLVRDLILLPAILSDNNRSTQNMSPFSLLMEQQELPHMVRTANSYPCLEPDNHSTIFPSYYL